MGILGLTNDETGAAIQRLPVSVKISIGTGPTANHNAPTKLDHFLLQRKRKRDKDVIWEPEPELHALYGDEPNKSPEWYVQNGKIRELGIVLMDDFIDNVFPTELAWWTTTECRCRGMLVQVTNGAELRYEMQATRRTKDHPEGEPWPGTYHYPKNHPTKSGQAVEACGDTCPDLDAGRCKPSGDMRCVLDKLPMVGSIARLHTTSYVSVRHLHAGLTQIRKLTGGRLAGIRAMLKVRPEKMSYWDKDGTKKLTTVYVLSIEVSSLDMQKLLQNMTEAAQLFQQTRKLLGIGRIEVVEDDEPILTREIGAEFPAENGEEERQPKKITQSQWEHLWAAARSVWGKGRDQEIMQLIQSMGFEKSKDITTDRYEEICVRLKEGPPKPEPVVPKAVVPPMREPGEKSSEEEFTLSSESVEPAPEPEAQPSPALAKSKPKPKDIASRGDALAERLGIDAKQLRAFIAKECGVGSVSEAPRNVLGAVVTALEKFVADVGVEQASLVILGDKQAHQLAKRAWQSFLFDELKQVNK